MRKLPPAATVWDQREIDAVVDVLQEGKTLELGEKVVAFEAAVARLLEHEDPESAIIFCNTKADVRYVTGYLQKRAFNVDQISGDLPQAAMNGSRPSPPRYGLTVIASQRASPSRKARA